MVDKNSLSFEEWMRVGIERGWCGPPVCYTHDGLPTTETDDAEWDAGSDPCIHIVRLYEDEEHKRAVEANHSPSNWRNIFTKK